MSERKPKRLQPVKTDVEFVTHLRGELAERFVLAAQQRQVRPVDLAANILETVTKDDLFAAVLDG